VSSSCRDLFSHGEASLHHRTTVRSLDDIYRALESVSPIETSRSLDFVGHSARASGLLLIGDDVVDMLIDSVRDTFARIANSGILAALNISCIRLLGCNTTATPSARYAIIKLASIMRKPVYGSIRALRNAHFGVDGFRKEFEHVLQCARSENRNQMPQLAMLTP
jgi:hypothetical protein